MCIGNDRNSYKLPSDSSIMKKKTTPGLINNSYDLLSNKGLLSSEKIKDEGYESEQGLCTYISYTQNFKVALLFKDF